MDSPTTPTETITMSEMSKEDGRHLLKVEAQRRLSLSAEQFIAQWDSGSFNGTSRSRDVMRVAMLLPFGR